MVLVSREEKYYGWRRSRWAKAIATFFIILVLIGNIWFVKFFEGVGAPEWLQWAFLLTTGGVAFSGLGLLLRQVFLRFSGDSDGDKPSL